MSILGDGMENGHDILLVPGGNSITMERADGYAAAHIETGLNVNASTPGGANRGQSPSFP